MSDRTPVVPTLELIGKSRHRRLFELDGDVLRIGRDAHSQICLPDNRVSTRHARIVRRTDGSYAIEDTDSRNGTRLDGQLLDKFKAYELHDGCAIRICDFTLVFHRQAVEVRESDSSSPTILESLTDFSSLSISSRSERAPVVLNTVLEINRILGGLELNEALGRALEEICSIFRQAEGGFILTMELDGKLSPRATHRRDGGPLVLSVSQTVLSQVMSEGKGLIVSDAETPESVKAPESIMAAGIRTAMCVPLPGRGGKPIGVIQIDSRLHKSCFGADDLELLGAVAIPIGVVVENHRLLKERAALTAATEVQAALLPRRRPDAPGYTFWEYYQPAMEVGGDYYDYIPISRAADDHCDRFAVVVADVSGKGMPAALLMANLCPEVRHLVRSGLEPRLVAAGVNRHVASADLPCRFVTFVLLIIDTRNHHMTVVNAGHYTPIIRRAGGLVESVGREETGLPLGIDPDGVYEQSETTLEPGDVVVLLTDGVPDALDTDGTQFTLERVLGSLGSTSGDPTQVGDFLFRAVRSHMAGRGQADDIAIVCFGRT